MLIQALLALLVPLSPRAPSPRDTLHRIDHLILGAASLDSGLAEFERLTGVRPVFGGVHPGRGTQNALVALGDGAYLEILVPRTDAPDGPDTTPLRGLKRLTPIGWAIRSSDLARSREALQSSGFAPGEVSSGSRRKPDGGLLAWTAMGLGAPAPLTAPFLIQWSRESAHPSTTSPGGCTLVEVVIRDPKSADLERLVRAFAVAVTARAADTPAMTITLACPGGRVTFGEG